MSAGWYGVPEITYISSACVMLSAAKHLTP